MFADSQVFDALDPDVELAADVFRLLSDPTRIRIVLALQVEELPVNRLAKVVNKPPTVVSQHLAKLRMGRMVAGRRRGTSVLYRLVDEHAATLVAQALYQAEHLTHALPGHHLRDSARPPQATQRTQLTDGQAAR